MEQNFLMITVGVIGVLIMSALSKEGLEAIFNHHVANFCLLFNSSSNNLIIPNLGRDEVWEIFKRREKTWRANT